MQSQDPALLWNHKHSRWFDMVWLVYSVFFFIEPAQRNTAQGWARLAIAYVIFLGLYIGIVRARSRRMAYVCMAALAVLGLIYFPMNTSAIGMLMYVTAMAPFVTESIAASVAIFAGVVLAVSVEGMLLHITPWAWGTMCLISLAVGTGNLFGAQRMRANKKLFRANEEIAHLAKLAERERISRDLHDVLGHTLSVVVLKSELAGKLMERNPERAHKEIAEVEHIARQALAEVREAIRGYRSDGLAAEIDRARATLDAAGVALDCEGECPKLRPAEETVLSLVVREATTNIVRHAQASQCRITFQRNDSKHTVVLEDNGSGGVRQEGSGLRGMRERVESLGGNLQIHSATGTRLTIEIPA